MFKLFAVVNDEFDHCDAISNLINWAEMQNHAWEVQSNLQLIVIPVLYHIIPIKLIRCQDGVAEESLNEKKE